MRNGRLIIILIAVVAAYVWVVGAFLGGLTAPRSRHTANIPIPVVRSDRSGLFPI